MRRDEANTAPKFIVLGVSPDIPLPPSTFLVRTVGVNPSVKIHIFATPGCVHSRISAAAQVFTAAVADDPGLLIIETKLADNYSL